MFLHSNIIAHVHKRIIIEIRGSGNCCRGSAYDNFSEFSKVGSINCRVRVNIASRAFVLKHACGAVSPYLIAV